jgi:hypothetical protein
MPDRRTVVMATRPRQHSQQQQQQQQQQQRPLGCRICQNNAFYLIGLIIAFQLHHNIITKYNNRQSKFNTIEVEKIVQNQKMEDIGQDLINQYVYLPREFC